MKQVFRTIRQADNLPTISARFKDIYGVSLADTEEQWLAFLDRGRCGRWTRSLCPPAG